MAASGQWHPLEASVFLNQLQSAASAACFLKLGFCPMHIILEGFEIAANICNIKVKPTSEVNSGFMAGFVVSS